MESVILTGSTGGLGECLASEINKCKNLELICVYRNEKKYKNLLCKRNIACKGYQTHFKDDYLSICDQISKESDEVILILNAFAITPIKTIGTFEPEEIDCMIDGNLKQIIHILNSVVHFCKTNHISLRVINLDSGAADFPLKGWGNYCAAKAYVNSFLKVAGLENPEFKIVSFDPGVMDTDMQTQIRKVPHDIFDKVEEFVEYKKNEKLNLPTDVAKYIVSEYIEDWKAKGFREKYLR